MALTISGNSLQTSNIIVSDIDHMNSPDQDMELFTIAHGNRSMIPYYDYTSKEITLKGTLVSDSITNLDALIDTFKGYFTGKDKEFDMSYSGATRRYIVKARPIKIDRPGGLLYAYFNVPLICGLPFGFDTTVTALASETFTITPKTIAITVGGNAEFQYPTIDATLTSGTGLASASVSIGNNNNGQICTITRTWMAGDVIHIDPSLMLVTVNGTEVYFTGSVPIFSTGAGAVSWSDTFTTRNVTVDVDQYRYWL